MLLGHWDMEETVGSDIWIAIDWVTDRSHCGYRGVAQCTVRPRKGGNFDPCSCDQGCLKRAVPGKQEGISGSGGRCRQCVRGLPEGRLLETGDIFLYSAEIVRVGTGLPEVALTRDFSTEMLERGPTQTAPRLWGEATEEVEGLKRPKGRIILPLYKEGRGET